MSTANAQLQNEIEELQKRLDWLDQERLKSIKKMTTLEQNQTIFERELETRDQRIKDLEEKFASAILQLSRASKIESELNLYKDELVKLIERYDSRRIEGQEELEKLRRIEHEMNLREIADIKKEIAPIPRLENELLQRQAEEERLTVLIGKQQATIGTITSDFSALQQQVTFIGESERTNARSVAEIHAVTSEQAKKLEGIETRLEVINHSQIKQKTSIQELSDSLADLQQTLKSKVDQIQISEHKRDKRLADWQSTIDEFSELLERYAAEWIKYSLQFKESKMAIQTLAEFQERLETQQQEAAELARIEANQLKSRWDSFRGELEKSLKNFEIDREQRWARAGRTEKSIMDQLQEINEMLEAFQEDKDALWRIQNAQADVMKMLPRIWKEEVEKARTHNPNRRRQPALVPVSEE